MKTLGYYNGVVDELENCRVPMLDRGFYFGDGVFNVLYCRNRHPYELEMHLEELYASANALRIVPRESPDQLKKILFDLLLRMDDGDLWVYLQFTRGTALRDHAFPKGTPNANLCVMIKPSKIKDIHTRVRCITTEDRRHLICNVKTLNYAVNVMAAQEAVDARVDECIFRRDGVVTECVHANLGILKDGVIYTHPANEKIYAGCGRKVMMTVCKTLGIPVKEATFSVEEMMEADEIFRISGSSLCNQIVEIDGKAVGGKDEPLLHRLQNALLERYLEKTE